MAPMIRHLDQQPRRIQAVCVALSLGLGQFLTQTATCSEWPDGLNSFLKAIKEEDSNLLDRTMILYGSHLGNARSHNNTNMPILLAGGGFKHGQHLAFDPENNYPLPRLFVSMLQHPGLEVDTFASGKGTMTGLDPTA